MVYLYIWSLLQIVFESLPVSSSGNVLLWMNMAKNFIPSLSFSIAALEFDFLLHGPSMVVATLYFWQDILWYVRSVGRERRFLFFAGMYCAWADLLTGVWYFTFKALGTTWWRLSAGFCCTGGILLSLQFLSDSKQSRSRSLTFYDATVLGMVQGVALLPGLSRFAVTFVAARHLGYAPMSALRYSFLIQMPLLGAAFLKGCYTLYWFEHASELLHPLFGLTILIATIVSYYALCFVATMIQQKRVHLFGWYVWGLAILALVYGK